MKQVLEFKQLKWASTEDINRLRNSAYYECAFCKKPILPNQKAAMLANGEWRADNLQADGSHRSFHLSSLYSPESWKSWGEIAVEWKKCHKDRSGLHNFINSTLAELWAEKIEEADFTTLDARQADYDPATENWGLQKRRIMTVDVQADGQWFQWLVMSWGLAGACRVLAWGKCFNLNEVQSKALEWKVDSVGIDDNGSVAPQIDQWCAAHQKNPMWNPIRGVTVPHFTSMASGREVKRAWEVQNVDAFIGTAMQGKQGVIRRFLLCADTNKDMLWALIHGKVGQFQFPKTEGFGKDFKESLLSEQPREKIVSGFTKRVWTKIHRRNEIFDLCYYSVAIAGILGLLQSVEANLADQPAVATAGNTT
jgi:phage terminase large subunit GpA-like protein